MTFNNKKFNQPKRKPPQSILMAVSKSSEKETVSEKSATSINRKPVKTRPKPIRTKSDFKGFLPFKHIDPNRVKNPDILMLFVRWHATLSHNRNPSTQKEFAVKYKISEDSLSDWKRLNGFWDEVKEIRPQQLRKLTIKIDYGLAKSAMAGNPKAVELWHKLYEGYNEKIRIQEDLPTEISEEDRKAVEHALKNIGLASIIEFNDDQEKMD